MSTVKGANDSCQETTILNIKSWFSFNKVFMSAFFQNG